MQGLADEWIADLTQDVRFAGRMLDERLIPAIEALPESWPLHL